MMTQVKVWENYISAKKLLSKLENIGVTDYCEHISTTEIGNLKITDEVNIFCNRPFTYLKTIDPSFATIDKPVYPVKELNECLNLLGMAEKWDPGLVRRSGFLWPRLEPPEPLSKVSSLWLQFHSDCFDKSKIFELLWNVNMSSCYCVNILL